MVYDLNLRMPKSEFLGVKTIQRGSIDKVGYLGMMQSGMSATLPFMMTFLVT